MEELPITDHSACQASPLYQTAGQRKADSDPGGNDAWVACGLLQTCHPLATQGPTRVLAHSQPKELQKSALTMQHDHAAPSKRRCFPSASQKAQEAPLCRKVGFSFPHPCFRPLHAIWIQHVFDTGIAMYSSQGGHCVSRMAGQLYRSDATLEA